MQLDDRHPECRTQHPAAAQVNDGPVGLAHGLEAEVGQELLHGHGATITAARASGTRPISPLVRSAIAGIRGSGGLLSVVRVTSWFTGRRDRPYLPVLGRC